MVYDIFFMIFLVFYLPYYYISGKWKNFDRQRIGEFTPEVAARIRDSRAIWLHAVSVGEVMASVPLYEEIRKTFPSEKIIVSTVTPAGNKIAREKFKDALAVIYLPLDLSSITGKVVKLINPKTALIAETEIWPNFIMSLKKSGAKVAIFNGRVSPRSFRNYKAAKILLKGVLQKVDLFLMQSKTDADRIIAVGAPKEKVSVTGSLKFDAALVRTDGVPAQELRKKIGLAAGEKLLIAGSTNPGEEDKVLRSYKDISHEFPGLRLLIAPRHTGRVVIITEVIKEAGFAPRFTSKPEDKPLGKDQVMVLDEMGLLAGYYSAADLVFTGGSLIKKGGQNPLEAVFYSKPVLFGPYMHNFESIASGLVSAGAAIQVKDETALTVSLRALLKDEDRCRRMGRAGRQFLESNAGAAKKDVELIRPLIS